MGVAGLGAALERLPGWTAALAFGGTLFLGWYGIEALGRALRPTGGLEADRRGEALSLGAALARIAAFTLLNPHVYLYTVLLVGSVGASQPPGGQPAFVAGAGLASALWFASLGYGARLLAPLFARPAAWRVLGALVGATMLVIAAELARHSVG
ncbi:LysE/ArgO family amino acid transporter [Belnapia moabensis]|uniref:LysE/ArgO family amino acid transporter n=1 Tax=Belnapia moabensis TaxID=365533 RepID=UPI00316AD8A7